MKNKQIRKEAFSNRDALEQGVGWRWTYFSRVLGKTSLTFELTEKGEQDPIKQSRGKECAKERKRTSAKALKWD